MWAIFGILATLNFSAAQKRRDREEAARQGEVKIGPGPQFARCGVGSSGPNGKGGMGGVARNTGPAQDTSNDLLNPLNIASPLSPLHQSIFYPSPTPAPSSSYDCAPSPSPSPSSYDHSSSCSSSSSSSSSDYGSSSSSSSGGSDW